MIKLITGKRGTGKTKILIDAIHEAENKSNGNVVAIQKGSSLNTDITPKVRPDQHRGLRSRGGR